MFSNCCIVVRVAVDPVYCRWWQYPLDEMPVCCMLIHHEGQFRVAKPTSLFLDSKRKLENPEKARADSKHIVTYIQ